MAAFVATTYPRASAAWRPLTFASEAVARPSLRQPAPPAAVEAPTPEPPVEVPAQADLAARLTAAEEALAAEREAHARTLDDLEEARKAAGRAAASIEEEAQRLRSVADGVALARRRVVEEVREGVGTLVLTAARKLAGEALRCQPGLVEALVTDAVATLGREGLVVRVSPADVERTRLALDGTGAEVVADPRVDGGCIATTPFGSVDASLATADQALRLVVERWETAGWRAEDDA